MQQQGITMNTFICDVGRKNAVFSSSLVHQQLLYEMMQVMFLT